MIVSGTLTAAICLVMNLALYSLSKGRKAMLAFPLLLAASDYTENICVLCLLKASEPSQRLAAAASAATTAKTVLMYVTILLILFCLVLYLVKKRSARAKA